MWRELYNHGKKQIFNCGCSKTEFLEQPPEKYQLR